MVANDLISRKAAIKLLKEWADGYSYLEVPVSSIEPKLNELPTAEITLEQIEEYCRPRCLMIVTAEFFHAMKPFAKKKGKWLHPYQSHIASECSVCHMQMPISDYFHFCPHCGAKMEET